MTTVARSRVRFRFDIYVVMSIVLLALVGFGFSHTVPDDLQTPGFPLFLAVHGAVFPAFIVGVCAVVLGQATTDLLAPSPIATAMLHALGTH